MTDLRLLHRNHQAFWRRFAGACGGTVEDASDGLIVTTGVPAAPFNQLHCPPEGSPSAALHRAREHFRRSGLPWRVVCEQRSDGVAEFARRLGVEPEPPYPVLSLPLERWRPAPDRPELAVSAARTIPDLRAFTDCAGASYRHDPGLLRPLVSRATLADPDFRIYLGRVDGRCVAISVGVWDGETVGVYVVGVRRGFRRRGLGRAMTDRAIREGAARGARCAVLQATTAGQPLYTAMGFRRAAEYHLWDFAPASVSSGGADAG